MLTGWAGIARTGLLDRMVAGRIGMPDGDEKRWEGGDFGASLGRRPGGLTVDDDLAVAMEGELYGEHAGSKDDAHIVATNFREHGLRFAARLNGNFAIAVYDRVSRQLHLVTDHASTRPLLYGLNGATCVFGTQVGPLLVSGHSRARLDLTSFLQLMSFDCVFGERSLVEDLRYVPPASVLTVDRDGRATVTAYLHHRFAPGRASKVEWQQRIRGVLDRAVSDRMDKSAERVGLLLSGGVDSRTILAFARRPVVCVTLGERPNRETRIAQEVARTQGQEFVFVTRPETYYADGLREASLVGAGQHRFDQLAHFIPVTRRRELPPVVFTGFPADTYLKGTRLPYRELTIAGRTLTLPVLRRLNMVEAGRWVWDHCAGRSGLSQATVEQVLRASWRERRREVIAEAVETVVQSALDAEATPVDVVQFIPARSMNQQRVFGNVLGLRPYRVERSPYLDRRVFELYLELPPELRANGTAFRAAMRPVWGEIGRVPESASGVYPYRSRWIRMAGRWAQHVWDEKPGYLRSDSWPGFAHLLRRPAFTDALDRMAREADERLFEPGQIQRLVAAHRAGVDHTGPLMTLLTLTTWMRESGVDV